MQLRTYSVRTICGNISEFSVTIGLHQGFVVSLYFFTLVMDKLTKHIQDGISWCMLFAHDIVMVDEIKIGVNRKLEL